MDMPCVVNDIRPYLLYEYKDKENKYAIGSISRDRFIEVDESNKNVVMQAISLMDGNHTYETIDEMIKDNTGTVLQAESLYGILKKADLIREQGNSQTEKSEFETFGFKIFEVGLEKFGKVFLRLSVLTVPAAVVTLFTIIFTAVFVILNLDAVSSVSLLGFEDHYIRNIMSILLIMTLSISLHELAHGVTAARYGIMPRKLSLSMYLYVSPIVYIKLPGLYTIKPKDRIKVWIAGVTVNALLGCIGIVASIFMKQNNASEFVVSVMDYLWYVNLTFIIMNLCPLMPLDGYFILATLMKIPNLRKRSFISIGNSIKNRSIQISAGQFLYFFLSILAMGAVFLREILAMTGIFVENLSDGIGSAFWSIKHYILILAVMMIIKIVRTRHLLGGKANS